MTAVSTQIEVMFPVDLLEDLDRLAPSGKRDAIIIAATAEYVRKIKTLRALKETAGAWSTESHPELATPEAIDHWLNDLRAEWRTEPLWPDNSNG